MTTTAAARFYFGQLDKPLANSAAAVVWVDGKDVDFQPAKIGGAEQTADAIIGGIKREDVQGLLGIIGIVDDGEEDRVGVAIVRAQALANGIEKRFGRAVDQVIAERMHCRNLTDGGDGQKSCALELRRFGNVFAIGL